MKNNFTNPQSPVLLFFQQYRYLVLVTLFTVCYTIALTIGAMVRVHQTKWADIPMRYMLGFSLWLVPVACVSLIYSKRCPKANSNIFSSTALLTGIGILTIWRLQPSLAIRQNIWWLASIPIALLLTSQRIDLRAALLKYRWILLLMGITITALTIIIGIYPTGVGPQLWLNIGGFIFQPSEILKPILIIVLAGLFSSSKTIRRPSYLILLSVFIIGLSLLFFTIQKDLGTASVLVSVYILMLFHFTKKKWILLLALVALIAALLTGYRFIPLVQQRVDTWLNPWNDPAATSYQVTQSMIAIAEGGILGTGPNLGSPSLVPLAHSDFIYTAVIEELGLAGTLIITLSILLLAFSISLIGSEEKTSFEHFFAVGVAYYLTIQSFLIIAGNIKLFPLTGVTLPLVSTGGSSMLTTIFCIFTAIRFSDKQPSLPDRNRLLDWKGMDLTYPLIAGIFVLLFVYQLNWSLIQRMDLLRRPENLRPMIADLYSPRGDILDRNETILTATIGKPGSYRRVNYSSATSQLIGYSDIVFGQTGIEAYQNDVLRSELFYNLRSVSQLLYNQHPEGADLFLTIDNDLQFAASQYFQNEKGAAVMLNPITGEILLLYSSPEYNPNKLTELMQEYRSDPNSPLLNRATMGQYPPATVLTPLFAANYLTTNPILLALPDSYLVFYNGETYGCADKGVIAARWSDAIQAGCPAPARTLSKSIGDPARFAESTGLTSSISLDLELAPSNDLPENSSLEELSLGITNFLVSPLQIAYLYTSFYNADFLPALTYTHGIELNSAAISIMTHDAAMVSASSNTSEAKKSVMELLRADDDSPFWYALGSNRSGNSRNTWFVGGTINTIDDSQPLLLVIMLEKDDANLAHTTGLALLRQALQSAN